MNFDRITNSVDVDLLDNAHVMIVGAGGAYNLILDLARTGVGRITVWDIDTVDDTNIVRQGYEQTDIGKYKVDAIGEAIQRINPDVDYIGIEDNFLDLSMRELGDIFGGTDLCLFLTDSFEAQALGNKIAIEFNLPAIWAGWYAKSQTAEIFFQVPSYTPACFRCAVSSRYKAQQEQEVKVSSQCNTIFHSALLDSYIGLLALGILHRNHPDTTKESVRFFNGLLNEDGTLDWNFLHLKVHPDGGNPLFDKLYNPIGKHAQNFMTCWQQVEPELPPKYKETCPDCLISIYICTRGLEMLLHAFNNAFQKALGK